MGNSQRLTSGAGAGRGDGYTSDPAEEKAVVRYAREHNLGKLFSVARPRAAGGVGKRLLTDGAHRPRSRSGAGRA